MLQEEASQTAVREADGLVLLFGLESLAPWTSFWGVLPLPLFSLWTFVESLLCARYQARLWDTSMKGPTLAFWQPVIRWEGTKHAYAKVEHREVPVSP